MGRGERIPVKTRREVERMREAGRHVAEILLELRERVAPGVTTAELDAFASIVDTSSVVCSVGVVG